MHDVLYRDREVVVRRSIAGDAEYLKDKLRKSDIEEIWASHRHTPETALRLSVRYSIFACTVIARGKPVMMFGVNSEHILGDHGTIWMLATDQLKEIRIVFLRHSKGFIDLMLSIYPYLDNYVDDRNKESISWLRFCGAKIEEPVPFGVGGELFRHFYFSRGR